MATHLETKHTRKQCQRLKVAVNVTGAPQYEKHSFLVGRPVYHCCRECKSLLLCDRRVVQTHVYSAHKTTVAEYARKHNLKVL